MRGLLRPHPAVRPGLLEALRTQLEAGIAKSLRITGPVTLLIGTVADEEYLKRDGTSIVGGTPPGAGDLTPPGAIIAYGGPSAPGGWLLCNGAAINRTTYSDLFTIIGTAYGVGNGSTTFNIPNLKQRFPLGKADSGTGDELGEVGGAIDHDHTYDTVIAHLHSVNPPNRTSTGESAHTHASGLVEPGAGGYTTKQAVCGLAGSSIVTGAGSSHTHGVNIPSFNSGSTGSAEGTTASENPPFQVVNYIIKT